MMEKAVAVAICLVMAFALLPMVCPGGVSQAEAGSLVSRSVYGTDVEVSVDKASYTVAIGQTLEVSVKVTTYEPYEAGTHKYIGYFAYYSQGQWNQVQSWYIDGGVAVYTMKMSIQNWESTGSFTFVASVFPIDNFATGASLADRSFSVRILPEHLTLTLDANGGMCSMKSTQVTYGSEYGGLPEPSREGYTFDGWYTMITGGTEVTSSTLVTATSDHTLYARWTEKEKISLSAASVGTLPNVTYTGSSFEPKPTVVVGSRVLTEGSDYVLDYLNNVNAGTATVRIVGVGAYAGSTSTFFTIGRAPIDCPAAAMGLVYTGKPQTGVIAGEGYERVGTYDALGAGTYICLVTPDSNHQWSDGTFAAKTINWSIGKAVPSLTVASATARGAVGAILTNTVAYDGDGSLSVESSNSSVATARVVNGMVSVEGVGVGTAVITVSASEGANYRAKSTTFSVSFASSNVGDDDDLGSNDSTVNPAKVSAVAKSYTVTQVRKKARSYKALKVTGAKGAVTYAKVSGSSKLTVNKTTGKVTVKKGTKVGAYKAKVRVSAAGTESYQPKSVTKTVSLQVVPAAAKIKSVKATGGAKAAVLWSGGSGASKVRVVWSVSNKGEKAMSFDISAGGVKNVSLPSAWRGRKVSVTVTSWRLSGGVVLCGKAVKKTVILR